MTRATFTVEVPNEEERGVRVRCQAHQASEEFRTGHRKGTFYCEGCGFEIEIDLHDDHEWRDWGE